VALATWLPPPREKNAMTETVIVTPDQIKLQPGAGANVKGLHVMRVHDGVPYVNIIESPPNTYARVHSHDVDEVMVVVSGKMFFIGRWCEVGSVIYVPAHEEYWYSTGAEPCRMALVRPQGRGFFTHGLEAHADSTAAPVNVADD
jgi:mannose-6-phosphate isomerase-like protein (cupin superfamily)